MFSMILRLLYVYCIVVMMRSRIFLISAFLSVSLPQSTSRHKRMSFFFPLFLSTIHHICRFM